MSDYLVNFYQNSTFLAWINSWVSIATSGQEGDILFNLLISANPESWDNCPFELDRSRAAIEYTADEISERYKFFDESAIEELKSFPSLFVIENEQIESRIGYITNIRFRQSTIVIDFEFIPDLPSLPIGTIEDLRNDIDLGRWELSRTHWAIKDESLFEILFRKGYITQGQLDAQQEDTVPPPPPPPVLELAIEQTTEAEVDTSKVFIVHGHDDIAKLEMADFVKELGLEAIILHMQASGGRTIIEKIDDYSNVGFGIVLYTECDIGAKRNTLDYKWRARQNVIFEHGYLIGKLGRSRVTAVMKGNIETPNDISGVVYITMNQNATWKEELKLEMRNVGYDV